MSADNGIYIVEFPDGFRVAHCQAIENIDYYPEGSKERKEMLKSYFGKSKVYKKFKKANKKAWKMAQDYTILEYGIAFLGEYESFE
jgi:hypothetical protein